MDLLCVSLLLLLIETAQGTTYFLYWQQNGEVRMFCEPQKWQIDTDYNNEVDCNVTLNNKDSSSESEEEKWKCGKIKRRDIAIVRDCNKAVGIQKTEKEKCFKVKNLEKNHGVFACVRTFQSQYVYPFKPSDQNDYFILAFAKPEVVTPLAEKKEDSLKIREGEPLTLMCNFTISKNFKNKPYTVYWMKTSGESTTCVYSYDFQFYEFHYDSHCFLENDHLSRISNTTSVDPNSDPHLHNLIIKNGTQLDSGQYACALSVIVGSKSYWVVITNITVIVGKREPSERQVTPLSRKSFIFLYVALLAILLIIGVFAIAFYMKKRNIVAKGSQSVRKQRHQRGEETADPDCSPSAVSGRELEPYSVVQLSASPVDSVEGGQAKVSVDPYSIVRLNSQYETSRPSPQDKDCSRSGTGHDAGNLKQSEGSVDTGANVYESINDTYSICQ